MKIYKRTSNICIVREKKNNRASEHPGEPCEATIMKYRKKCSFSDGFLSCWGSRTFIFLMPSEQPTIEPIGGHYAGEVVVTARIGTNNAKTTSVICHYGTRQERGVFSLYRFIAVYCSPHEPS